MSRNAADRHDDFDRGDDTPPSPPKLWRSSSEVIAETMAEVNLRHEFPDVGGLRTGINALDDHAREAFMPGSLIVIAGESGRGKTALMTQLAVAFSAQVPTLVVTLEDRATSTLKRALANVSRTNVGRIRSGFAGESGIPKAVTDAAEELANGNLDIIDGVALTVEQIAAQVWFWKRERNCENAVVLIDQLSHIAPSARNNLEYFRSRNLPTPPAQNAPETQILEWQTWVLKTVAERLGVCVVLAHQLNEAHGDGKPTMRSVRGSRGIVHKCNLLVIPWVPEELPNPFAGPGQPLKMTNTSGEGRLIIAKGRDVGRAEEKIFWIGAEQRFADPDQLTGAYSAPQVPSVRAREGMRRLLELRAQFEERRALPPAP
jgi:replicative DNA helicase